MKITQEDLKCLKRNLNQTKHFFKQKFILRLFLHYTDITDKSFILFNIMYNHPVLSVNKDFLITILIIKLQ